ncbi:MAG: hypothetical protein OEY18_14615 [Candidatus Aminicenantes bacterium]|nr:hypothetical protein [Candidatus Aminicenantes bacterium]MDH5385931.1 hypothetical protein [Candidatus Aminicenantes bacterium]MDH5742488.1 hypothetical protein [Candidatus Aminicenantes bacterium]
MLSIDVSLIVIFVIVWILAGVLTKVYYNPVRKIMSKRESEIEHNKEVSKEALEKYEGILQKIEEELKVAKAAARATREKFEREALNGKERMLEEISRECRSQVEKAKIELDKKVRGLKKELEPQSQQMAERIEKRLLH